MTPDVPRDAFLALAARSLVLDPARAARVASRLPKAPARELADALIRSGELTHFQAEKLLRGLWQGLAIGPYRILAPLARGGMGTVYLARDTRQAEELGDDVLVALKVLPPRVVRTDVRMLHRFRREIDLGRRVNHPNVARTLAGGEADGVNYLAMEYVPGKTVRELVDRDGPMSPGEAARVFADVAAGLAGVHERGLVHRDLKPSNVMVTPDGRAKLLDLGFAFAPGEPLPDDPSVVGGKGYIVGTMDYISPEQARNAVAADPRSDLYSLGCSLYFALTGTLPFPGGTAKEKIHRQRTLDPVPLAELNPSLPPGLVKVVGRLMSKSPAGRPPTATAARDALLPFATAPVKVTTLSVRDAVGAVDSPDTNPELWTEDDPLPPQYEPIAVGNSAPSWRVAAWFLGAIAGLALLLTLLRRV